MDQNSQITIYLLHPLYSYYSCFICVHCSLFLEDLVNYCYFNCFLRCRHQLVLYHELLRPLQQYFSCFLVLMDLRQLGFLMVEVSAFHFPWGFTSRSFEACFDCCSSLDLGNLHGYFHCQTVIHLCCMFCFRSPLDYELDSLKTFFFRRSFYVSRMQNFVAFAKMNYFLHCYLFYYCNFSFGFLDMATFPSSSYYFWVEIYFP